MEPRNLRFGGGASHTVLHPLVAAGLVLAVLLILTRPRNTAITPFLLAAFGIPLDQVVVLGGLHFPALRILILAVAARRLFFRRPPQGSAFAESFNSLDRVVALWTVLELIVLSLEWMEPQALIKYVGDFIDGLGCYMVVRFLIFDRETVLRTTKILALVCVINGILMVSEQFTHENALSFAGAPTPTIRAGTVRSEGVMGSLYGGVFAGVLLPMFIWLWDERTSRVAACAGFVGATAMVYASHASTSWMAFAGSIGALFCWPVRKWMRVVRWGIVATLATLHLVMNGPVWSLIEHIDLTGGSSSYHRYMLIDNCIRHFSDWWLLGCKTYGSWGFDMWDLCNQFVSVALTGGLISLVCYLTIFSRSFGLIGEARRRAEGNRRPEWFFWCVGSCLVAHVVAYFGVNCSVQLLLLFFTVLACICATVRQDGRDVPVRNTEDLPQWAVLQSRIEVTTGPSFFTLDPTTIQKSTRS